ncbi:type II toxin-antitoxin system PemK/MazF family toxin [Acidiferrobacter thiooxydans]|uniref:type II toxin-antitoxin system PemK/MazF family toxin n=2 Tax=Acidiferrobacter thiooxydans TaxID=163359 RepID=UPI001C3FF847
MTVTAPDDYGKPRPAVIVQADALPAGQSSVVICQMTPGIAGAPDFRITLEPTEKTACRHARQSWWLNP